MSKKLIAALIGLTSIAAMSTAALAHPKMTSSTPADNAMVAASPTEIRIVFNENLEQSLSGGDVLNKAGKKIETGKAVTDPADKKQLVIPIVGQLANDTYTVDWHAVAADSHRIKGKYTFTVKN